MKKLRSMIALLLCVFLLCACNNEQPPATSSVPTTAPASGELNYRVTVVDAMGEPFTSDVIVNFMQGADVIAMQAANAEGIAEKVLPRGEYAVQLAFTDPNAAYHYDKMNIIVTPEKTELTVTLANEARMEEKSTTTYDPNTGEETTQVERLYYAGTGCTYIPLNAQERTYVYFVPKEPGVYQFSVIGSQAVLGYFGSPYFIQSENLAELDDNGAFTINVSNGMVSDGNTGTSIFVLGIDGADLTDCIIRIQRISDPELTIEDYPWDIYKATVEIGAFTLGENVKVQDFDLTAESYTLVLNDADGFYHLNSADGPLVYAKLGVSSEYLDSIQTVLDTSAISRYFYDEDGNFLKKVSYSECLLDYIACMDEQSGLYPLTEDLAFIFQQRGEYVGWWDQDSHSYLFVDDSGNPIPGINSDIAWLFLCCYAEETTQPGPNDPDDTEPTDPPHVHAYESTVVAPSCLEQGYTRHTCACGDTYDDDLTEATGHSWGDWKVTKPATETETGIKERVCAHCDAKETAQIPVVIPEHTHAYTSAVTKEASCTEEGVLTYTCSCGDSYCESIAKLEHNYVSAVTAPTCVEKGFTTHTCSGCGDAYITDETEALGHTWGEWVVKQEPTLTGEGKQEHTCSTCGTSEDKAIESLMGEPADGDPVEVMYYQIAETMSFDAAVKAGEYATFKLYRMFDMVLTIESEDAYLIFDDQVVEPVDGVLTFTLVYGSNDVSSPCQIAIGNLGVEDVTFTVKLASIPGTQNCPVELQLGTFTTTTREGDYQGFYYTYTATKDGVLTVRFDSISIEMECEISLYNTYTNKFEVGTNASVSVKVNEGDVVQIHFAVLDSEYLYPSATITATATLE